MESMRTILRDLLDEHIHRWAGGTIYLRGRAYIKKVHNLSHTTNDDLAAWVTGGKEYATCVRLGQDRQITSSCTCPYVGGACKHAVALVLAARIRVHKKKQIPLLSKKDKLSQALLPIAQKSKVPKKNTPMHGSQPLENMFIWDTEDTSVATGIYYPKKQHNGIKLQALLKDAAKYLPDIHTLRRKE